MGKSGGMEEDLLKSAFEGRAQAYAPHSGYKVGAAVEDEQGRIWTGCNVENASFGATMCAERAAIFKMVSEGGREIRRLAVATNDGGPPCGMCLQVIREFASKANPPVVICAAEDGRIVQYSLDQLLPIQFDLDDRTKS